MSKRVPHSEGGGSKRGPRPDGGSKRGPRPDGGGSKRGPRPDYDYDPYYGGGSKRGPRPDGGGSKRGPRPEGGSKRGPRPDYDPYGRPHSPMYVYHRGGDATPVSQHSYQHSHSSYHGGATSSGRGTPRMHSPSPEYMQHRRATFANAPPVEVSEDEDGRITLYLSRGAAPIMQSQRLVREQAGKYSTAAMSTGKDAFESTKVRVRGFRDLPLSATLLNEALAASREVASGPRHKLQSESYEGYQVPTRIRWASPHVLNDLVDGFPLPRFIERFLNHAAPYVVEFIGTFMLCATIILAVASGSVLAPLAIGACLSVIVYFGGHVSGGNYNPAVSTAIFLAGRRKLSFLTATLYIWHQVVGGFAGACFAWAVTEKTILMRPDDTLTNFVGKALAVEMFFTFLLVYTVLQTATSAKVAGNSFYGFAIGFAVVVGAIAGGPISGGAFNPAVGTALCLTGYLSRNPGGSGLERYHRKALEYLWIYWIGPMGAGAFAAILFRFTNRNEWLVRNPSPTWGRGPSRDSDGYEEEVNIVDVEQERSEYGYYDGGNDSYESEYEMESYEGDLDEDGMPVVEQIEAAADAAVVDLDSENEEGDKSSTEGDKKEEEKEKEDSEEEEESSEEQNE